MYKIFTSHSLVSGSKPFVIFKVTQPFNLSRLPMHLADFLIILHSDICIYFYQLLMKT